MHIIIIAVGSSGDVHPLLGLGRTFTKEGHRVSFCTSPAFSKVVERCGLRFLPFGTEEEYYAAINNPALWNPRTSLTTLWKAVAGRIRPLYDLLCSEVDNDTIMAAHPWAFGARLLHEKHGVPLVSLQISPSTFLSAKRPPIHKQFTIPMSLPYPVRAGLLWAFDRGVLDRICAPDINRIRAELGLPSVTRIMGRWMHSPQSVLGLFPEWFAPPQTDWPRNVTLTGFPLFDEAQFRSMDPELEDFLAKGSAPVVFTPGSTLVDGLSYYSKAADTLNALGCRGIFLASQNTKLPPLSPNILARTYIPLSKLLPQAKALVHHGGIGTASQALAAGIPQLITPFAHDQFDNAARVESLNCGLQMSLHARGASMLEPLKRLLEDENI
ncbi:MAG: nucleotide disphospho-sugar-binding domain-containing protein [Acidobacteriaceae bacterium]